MRLLNSTQIPNKLLKAIIAGEFTQLELRVLLQICRSTIGWQKETDWLGLSLMCDKLQSTSKSAISLAIRNLIQKKAIVKESISNRSIYSLNAERWGFLDSQDDSEDIVQTMHPRQGADDAPTKDLKFNKIKRASSSSSLPPLPGNSKNAQLATQIREVMSHFETTARHNLPNLRLINLGHKATWGFVSGRLREYTATQLKEMIDAELLRIMNRQSKPKDGAISIRWVLSPVSIDKWVAGDRPTAVSIA